MMVIFWIAAWFFTSIGHALLGAGLLATLGAGWMIILSKL